VPDDHVDEGSGGASEPGTANPRAQAVAQQLRAQALAQQSSARAAVTGHAYSGRRSLLPPAPAPAPRPHGPRRLDGVIQGQRGLALRRSASLLLLISSCHFVLSHPSNNYAQRKYAASPLPRETADPGCRGSAAVLPRALLDPRFKSSLGVLRGSAAAATTRPCQSAARIDVST
jgi:hypothetical protein